MATSGIDSAIEESHAALNAILNGDPSVTSVFRREGDKWKLVHRHADPITTPRPASSVIAQ
jgi:ketosteroid isomerase-like protein